MLLVRVQFFEEERLRSYIAANQGGLMKSIDIPRMIRDSVESPDFDTTLVTALTDISSKPEGAMLMMVAPMVRVPVASAVCPGSVSVSLSLSLSLFYP
eukprot:COSAG02_NODE_16572_length_1073_cov_1.785421_2_plen_97_part_01